MGLIVVGAVTGTGADVDTTPKALRVILYDATGAVAVDKPYTYGLNNWIPNPANRVPYDIMGVGRPVQLLTDVVGNLVTRSQILTDEESFRDDYQGASYKVALTGSATFTFNNAAVSGFGTSFQSQALYPWMTGLGSSAYIRLSAETADDGWTRVAVANTETALVLHDGYSGVGGTGASEMTLMVPYNSTTSGGSGIAVANSILTITSGTTNGRQTYMWREGDYMPMTLQGRIMVSARNANQEAYFGFVDNHLSIGAKAYFRWLGTDANTIVRCVVGSSSVATDNEELSIPIPVQGTTASYHTYQVVVSPGIISFYIDSISVAQFTNHIFWQYSAMEFFYGWNNTGVPTSATFNIDSIYFNNSDQVEVTNSYKADSLPTLLVDDQGQSIGTKDGGQARPNYSAIPIGGLSSNVIRTLRIGRSGNLKTADQILFHDPFEGTAFNPMIWGSTSSTMAATVASNGLTVNSGLSGTAAAYFNLIAIRPFLFIQRSPPVLQFRGQISRIAASQTEFEFGFGAPLTTAEPTYGSFFRFRGTDGLLECVTIGPTAPTEIKSKNNLGVDQTFTLVVGNYYIFWIHPTEQGCRFVVEDSSGVPVVDTTTTNALTQAGPILANTHCSVFIRGHNIGAVTGAQLIVDEVEARLIETNTNRSFPQIMAGISRQSNTQPITFTQNSLLADSAPGVITPANGSASGNANLGGEYLCAAVAAGENRLSVFAYPVPAPYSLYVTEIAIPAPIVKGAAIATTPTCIEWVIGYGCNSNTISGDTLGKWLALPGMHYGAIGTAINSRFTGDLIAVQFQTPLITAPGQYFIVAWKMLSGTATGSQQIRGSVFINGYHE